MPALLREPGVSAVSGQLEPKCPRCSTISVSATFADLSTSRSLITGSLAFIRWGFPSPSYRLVVAGFLRLYLPLHTPPLLATHGLMGN